MIMNNVSLLEVDEQNCCLQQDWLLRIERIQQRICWTGCLVVAVVLENCCILCPPIYRHQISVFGGLEGKLVQKQSAHT